MPNDNGILDDDSNMNDEFDISGDTHDIRVYPLQELFDASRDSKQGDVGKLQVYSTFATAYIRKVGMEASSSQDDFDATAEQLLNEYGEPDTYVVGYYNKQTHWLDHVVFHPDNTTISP